MKTTILYRVIYRDTFTGWSRVGDSFRQEACFCAARCPLGYLACFMISGTPMESCTMNCEGDLPRLNRTAETPSSLMQSCTAESLIPEIAKASNPQKGNPQASALRIPVSMSFSIFFSI